MKEFLEQYKLDAVLVHTPANMRNISGFTGEGLVYVSKEDAWILTDSRYTIAAAKEETSIREVSFISYTPLRCGTPPSDSPGRRTPGHWYTAPAPPVGFRQRLQT